MFDFLKKFKLEWEPQEIENDIYNDISTPFYGNTIDEEEIQLAQRLCDHLNLIQDFKDRIDSINYLSAEARSNFENISYSTTNESLINSILSLGGKDGTVDFELAVLAIDILIDFMDKTALEAVLGKIE